MKILNDKLVLPVIPLRGVTLLPGTIAHFDITREKSVIALEAVMVSDQNIFLVTQKDAANLEYDVENLHKIGVVANVKQLIKLPSGIIRVLVDVKMRAKIVKILQKEPFFKADIECVDFAEVHLGEAEEEAMLRVLRDLIAKYYILNPRMNSEVLKNISEINDIKEILFQISIHFPFPQEDKQKYLEANDIVTGYELIVKYLSKEIEVSKIQKEFQEKIKERIDDNQKEYVLREQIKLIREELGEDSTLSDADQFLEDVKKLKANKTVKEKINKEINKFKSIASNSSESSVVRGYIETLLEMPWDKVSKDSKDIKHAKEILDRDHYGLEKVKERMLEFLAVRTLNANKGPSPIICLVGPPGTGKTSIAKSVADALNKKYVRISLGGVRDEAEIRGHRRTYVGAMPGRIATGLKQAGVKNPLMLLDEIDKLGNDYKGDPSSALLEVLDSEQNSKFRDHYIEIPIDLSEVFFVATANNLQTIPRPLLDRMELIEVTSYTENEKEHIASEHLIEKQMRSHGLTPKNLTISNKALKKIIQSYTKEAGVRSLERKIADICRKSAKEILEYNKKTIRITEANVEKYLGKPLYTIDYANQINEVGIVRGLAWTSVGGDTLQIEVNIMPGKGEVLLTGKLGDVMKESATAGLSYLRSVASKYDIKDDFFKEKDIHIHIPEGAVPKDGPSAGITMATAMLSAIIGIPVRADLAMTGEITLRGRVLPIGGLKEKILAAKVANIKTVLVPGKNRRDVDEISQEILKGVKIVFVDTMEEVLEIALCKK